MGPYRTIQDYMGPYRTIQDHSELFQAYGAVSNFFVTHSLTDSLTGAISRGACAPKNKAKYVLQHVCFINVQVVTEISKTRFMV